MLLLKMNKYDKYLLEISENLLVVAEVVVVVVCDVEVVDVVVVTVVVV